MVGGKHCTLNIYVGLGHKLALRAMKPEDKVIKYGASIGSATNEIKVGDHVHLNNMKSDYTASHSLEQAQAEHGE